MNVFLSSRYRVLIILLVSLATVSFHYGLIVKPTHSDNDLFHAIHGRLCYIPIILGAIWFSVGGGLATSLFIIALTLPYSFVSSPAHGTSLVDELTEMIFYLTIGLTVGILIALQRAERRRRETLSRELARQEHLSSLGQMAAGLAHEIKNPLGSIKGSSEILSDDFPEGSPKRDILQVLTKETGRLNAVVEDFLRFARPRPLKRSPVQVNDLIDDVVSQIEVDDRARNIRIVKDLDERLPTAPLDGEKLHQVFLNVILNAVTATPEGGNITIETRTRSGKNGSCISVRFRDDGVGIEEDEMDKIFDPFFTTSEDGTGLGLSISHMIVQHHGGHIEVERNGSRGTSVTITLPIVKE